MFNIDIFRLTKVYKVVMYSHFQDAETGDTPLHQPTLPPSCPTPWPHLTFRFCEKLAALLLVFLVILCTVGIYCCNISVYVLIEIENLEFLIKSFFWAPSVSQTSGCEPPADQEIVWNFEAFVRKIVYVIVFISADVSLMKKISTSTTTVKWKLNKYTRIIQPIKQMIDGLFQRYTATKSALLLLKPVKSLLVSK